MKARALLQALAALYLDNQIGTAIDLPFPSRAINLRAMAALYLAELAEMMPDQAEALDLLTGWQILCSPRVIRFQVSISRWTITRYELAANWHTQAARMLAPPEEIEPEALESAAKTWQLASIHAAAETYMMEEQATRTEADDRRLARMRQLWQDLADDRRTFEQHKGALDILTAYQGSPT